jgi:hypothetical protein
LPIVAPRCSGGASEISQPSPPAHVHAPPTPCRKRIASSIAIVWPNANPTLATDISPSPISTVRREPSRVASQPLGSAPSSVPAAYEPASTPAPVFVRSKRSAYQGSSGVIAA